MSVDMCFHNYYRTSRRKNGVNEPETGKHLQEEEIGGGSSLYQNEQGEYED